MPASKMPRRKANIWVPIKCVESSWHSMVEGVRASGCIAEGPVFVLHYTRRDDEVLHATVLVAGLHFCLIKCSIALSTYFLWKYVYCFPLWT